jgi:hypothetical protein
VFWCHGRRQLTAAVTVLQVFVHKIAGALADAGASLDDVHAAANAVAEQVRSVGVALGVCSVPGQLRSTRLDGNVMELGWCWCFVFPGRCVPMIVFVNAHRRFRDSW